MSPRPVRFLAVEYILRLHRTAMADQGGDPRLRDPGLLDSALAMPQQQFGGEFLHPDVPSMAGAYAFHICKNHPFIDGNKRAAFASMLAFLTDNGWAFDALLDDAEATVLAVADGSMPKEDLIQWIRRNAREKPSMELREFFASLTYQRISEFLHAGLVDPDPVRAHEGRFATMMEAAQGIPAINEANLGAIAAESDGNAQSAAILRAQSHLLVAIYRLAEDMGYEW